MPEIKKYLNRNGLEDYNALLPHSAGAMQEYVDAWLEDHPEATTTVQDGSITTQKLADASVTRNKLAADIAHLLGGMMLTKEVQSEILTAEDAYSVSPLSMTIDGKSTQNGTPTPEAPITIDSIEVLELPVTFTGKNMIGISAGVTYTYNSITLTSIDGAVIVSTNNSSNLTRTFLLNLVNNTISGGSDFYPINYIISESNSIPLPAGTYRFTNTGTISNGVRIGLVHGHIGERRDADYTANFTTDGTERAMLLCYVNSRASLYTAGPQTIQYQLEVGSATTAYEPYAGITAQIPMQGHVLRSLPDGTCDTMSLSYLRTSTREGWAWYSRELVKRVAPIVLNGILPSGNSYTDYTFNVSRSSGSPDYAYAYSGAWDSIIKGVGACDKLVRLSVSGGAGSVVDTDSIGNGSSDYRIRMVLLNTRLGIDWDADNMVARARKFNAWIVNNPITALCELATPITTLLDPIELPILHAPNCTVWSDPTTGLKMSYMRDANIVISDIEQAIADL